MTERGIQGGCLCGALRDQASGPPEHAHCYHCRTCQRSVGAPVTAWAGFAAGEPATFRTSSHLRRAFCATCGASICTLIDDDPLVFFNLASLDDPGAIPPELHLWTDDRVPWLTIDDQLPRHPGEP